MRLLIIFMFSPLFLFSQVLIGNDIDGLAAGDNSGNVSISSDGTIVAIGAPGGNYVRVFENSFGEWEQIGNTIFGDSSGDHFGSSVSLSSNGSIVAIGSPDAETAGYVRVFENISDVWTPIGDDLIGEAEYIDGDGFHTNFSFGIDVSISDDGNILAIAENRGGTWESGYGRPGYLHMYENISGTWTAIENYINTQISYLNKISISADGSTVAVFGYGDWDFFWMTDFGYVKVYKNISDVWTQVGSPFSGNFERLIRDVSLSDNGSKIAIGGNNYISVYENIEVDWMQLGNDIESEYNFYGYKTSLSEDGTKVVVGGSITRIYENSSGDWTQLGVDINEEAVDDDFGSSLELSSDGNTLIVGAPQNDGNEADAGHARVYDLSALLSLEESNLFGVKLYPNPATNQFTLELLNNQILERVYIYNNQGQIIKTSNTHIVKTSHLASGLYFVQVVTKSGKATKKLILK